MAWQETPYPFDEWTGKRLGYNFFQRFAEYDPERGGKEYRKLMKQPGKKLETDEAKVFLENIKALGEDKDPLVPWLASQFKKGELKVEDGIVKWNVGDDYFMPITTVIDRWADWYNAREHPLRQGVNVQNLDVRELDGLASDHAKAVAKEKKHKEMLALFKDKDTEIVHQFDNGFTVRHLTKREDLEDESCALGHCIGFDNQPYKEGLEDGYLQAYSLRDPDGIPKATWHYNTNDDTFAEIQGRSGHPKPEYMDMVNEWAEIAGKSQDLVGSYDYADGGGQREEYDYHFEVTINSASDYESLFDDGRLEYSHLEEIANEQGANFDPDEFENPDIEYSVNWDEVVRSLTLSANRPNLYEEREKDWAGIPYREQNQWTRRNMDSGGEYMDRPQGTLDGIDGSRPYNPHVTDIGEVWETMMGLASSYNNYYGDASGEEHAEQLDLALKRFKPRTDQESEGIKVVLEEWDEIRNKFMDPSTRFNEPDWDYMSGDEDEYPKNRFETDPYFTPPLWVDDYGVEYGHIDNGAPYRQFAVDPKPWWSSEAPSNSYDTGDSYGHDTTMKGDPRTDHSIWNKPEVYDERPKWLRH